MINPYDTLSSSKTRLSEIYKYILLQRRDFLFFTLIPEIFIC